MIIYMQKLKPSFVLPLSSVINKSQGKQKGNKQKLQGYAQNSPQKKLPLPTVTTVSITTTTSNSTVSTSSLTYNYHHHHQKNTPDDINQSSKTMSSLLRRRRCLSVGALHSSFLPELSLSLSLSFILSLSVSLPCRAVCSV